MESRQKIKVFLEEIVSKVNTYTSFMLDQKQIEKPMRGGEGTYDSHYKLIYSGISGGTIIRENLSISFADRRDSSGRNCLIFLDKNLPWLTDEEIAKNLGYIDKAIMNRQKKWNDSSRLILELVKKKAKTLEALSVHVFMTSLDPNPRLTLATDNDLTSGKIQIFSSEVKKYSFTGSDGHPNKHRFDFLIDDDNSQSVVDTLLTKLQAAVSAKPAALPSFFSLEDKDTIEQDNKLSRKPVGGGCIIC